MDEDLQRIADIMLSLRVPLAPARVLHILMDARGRIVPSSLIAARIYDLSSDYASNDAIRSRSSLHMGWATMPRLLIRDGGTVAMSGAMVAMELLQVRILERLGNRSQHQRPVAEGQQKTEVGLSYLSLSFGVPSGAKVIASA